jgi:regulator of PEP synthase PpsR (kinase-PPPase family)
MNNDQWFFINDFDDFVDHSRSLVFKFFGEVKKETAYDSLMGSISQMSKQELEEMNETLTHDESAIIIINHARKQINKKTKEVRYCLTDKLLQSIIEDMNNRMISNILNSLVNKGVLDSAYDSDQNDFIFWVKEDDDTKQSRKPEAD